MNKLNKMLWNVICIALVFIFISLIGTKILTGWSNVFSYRLFFVMSESMDPTIRKYQFVLGRTISNEDELEVGQIYVYRADGDFGKKVIIHRLVAVTVDGKYQFRGDNNLKPDSVFIERSNIGYRIVEFVY